MGLIEGILPGTQRCVRDLDRVHFLFVDIYMKVSEDHLLYFLMLAQPSIPVSLPLRRQHL
jgi:hypothetical protein